MTKTKKNSGFTLIEMLVVVGIIGILATILVTSVGRVRKSSIDTRRKANLENVRGAITMYYSAKSTWPTFTNWTDLITTLSDNGYLSDTVKADEDGDSTNDYSVCQCGGSCACGFGSVLKLTTRFEISGNEDCSVNSSCSGLSIGTGTCCALEVK